ncbi:hypothetical protein L3X38_026333 [Prunus dulcis]|uniref:Uncharacterized protein n=1 Tax=Prunus dulcis TaxID=3755 RepID=A0AAD4VMN3_PRUDU|nr:hypothetical protein L3X38_026333 [Prunus dulcis]
MANQTVKPHGMNTSHMDRWKEVTGRADTSLVRTGSTSPSSHISFPCRKTQIMPAVMTGFSPIFPGVTTAFPMSFSIEPVVVRFMRVLNSPQHAALIGIRFMA